MIKEYFEEIGGRPERPDKGTKRKGRASTAKSETGTPASTSKRPKVKENAADKAWSPPPGSWEHDVSHIDTVEQGIDPKTGKETKYAYIVWNNQKKTQHPLKHIYTKCPQKVRHAGRCIMSAMLTRPDAAILRESSRLLLTRIKWRHHGRSLLARHLRPTSD